MGFDDNEDPVAAYQARLAELQHRYTFGEAAMRLALEQAERAMYEDEIPVGAILLDDRRVLAAAHNLPITLCDPTAHAEVLALRDAAARLRQYRLVGTALYVTVEPCVMCVGAILNAR